jgi:hypothetical protein
MSFRGVLTGLLFSGENGIIGEFNFLGVFNSLSQRSASSALRTSFYIMGPSRPKSSLVKITFLRLTGDTKAFIFCRSSSVWSLRFI